MSEPSVTTEVQDHVLLIGLNRPEKRNAFHLAMLRELSEAYTEYEVNPSLWCAVLFAHGEHFTGGLDLAEVGPAVAAGQTLFPHDRVDPLGLFGRRRSKPVVCAAQGWCLTIGVELMLASDIRVAATDARFGQIEVKRGIMPFGGATMRLPQVAGWGNAMRWLLTGDTFDAHEAHRIGLVQELTEPGRQTARAVELAQSIARQAPLAVQATFLSARAAAEQSPGMAAEALALQARLLMGTRDAAEGMASFVERREGRFQGQ
jgi:enoyl-CoA hydratase/carnithine racemase